ncbi:MAG: 3-hydroxyacyl-CoA dehydrogenase NAD-binding domain-containing protein [Gemmatimonadales bacterium]|nr:3-hydroxyacyl-CoA dehydrogenase NAD-binding domain-containing protein [Gemmatimonadales bacterium]
MPPLPDVIGVLGFGQMGAGIAQVCAMAGCRVLVREPSDAAHARGLAGIQASLAKFVEKGKLAPAEREAALGRLERADTIDALAPCAWVIEAAPEQLELKAQLLREAEPVLAPEAIIATNTSSLAVGDLARALARPGRMVGLHFFNPVPLMPLVEVVRALTTQDDVVAAAMAFATRLGKTPVETKDGGGFIVNRLLVPYLLDAVRALEQGVGTVEAIDTAMQLGAGHPMGPFTLLDTIGLDTVLAVAEVLHHESGEPRHAPPALLRRYVAAGWLGRKAGRGFRLAPADGRSGGRAESRPAPIVDATTT